MYLTNGSCLKKNKLKTILFSSQLLLTSSQCCLHIFKFRLHAKRLPTHVHNIFLLYVRKIIFEVLCVLPLKCLPYLFEAKQVGDTDILKSHVHLRLFFFFLPPSSLVYFVQSFRQICFSMMYLQFVNELQFKLSYIVCENKKKIHYPLLLMILLIFCECFQHLKI